MSVSPAGMSPELRRGTIASVTLHVLLAAALLIGIPLTSPPEPPPETGVDMVFQAVPGPAAKAPARTTSTPAPTAPTPPKPRQLEETTPPPPPPPPPPPAPAVAQPPPPTPPPTPPTRPTPTPAEALPLPPPPVPPPPAPAPAQAQPAPPAPPLPLPPPAPPSPTAQPNPTANPAPASAALENTLEKLRAESRQPHAPQARANPLRGGAPNAGGNPAADDTAALSASQRGAIGEHVRPCWTSDPGALDLDKMQVLLTVTTDASGVVRRAEVAPADQGRLTDPRLRVFAERAVRAVMSSECANLPLPPKMLGKVNVLTFRFRP